MAKDDGGGQAFPVAAHGAWQSGMTLRQWYAGQAMQGLLASLTSDDDWSVVGLAQTAFAYADAMIAEGKK